MGLGCAGERPSHGGDLSNAAGPPAATVHPSWHALFREECGKPYFRDLMAFVAKQRSSCTVFPPEAATFAAFQHTPLDSVRVVVLGQDPYHGHGQAHGLSFSVPAGVKPLPPSLRNIVKEAATALPAGSASACGDLPRRTVAECRTLPCPPRTQTRLGVGT